MGDDSMAQQNGKWILTARPQGTLKGNELEWKEEPAPDIAQNQVRVRVLYLSLDPTNRIWMNAMDSYLPAIPLGEVMRGGALGVVEESRHPGFVAGDLVQGLLGWQRYWTGDGGAINKLPRLPIPLTGYFGLLGHIGLTAYFGLVDVGKPQAGETLVVSAAAGAVGSLAGQIGKILGLRVVGIAGGPDKCRYITQELGFDAAIDYKNEPLYPALRRACPNGIDIHFENVGGTILETVLALINLKARVVLCGMISQYNNAAPTPGPATLGLLVAKRARMEGFIVTDYREHFAEAVGILLGWHQAGKLKYRVDVVEGLENAPTALGRLFAGTNNGKLLVKVSDS